LFQTNNFGQQSPPWQIEDEHGELPDGSSPHTSQAPNPAAESSDAEDDSLDIDKDI